MRINKITDKISIIQIYIFIQNIIKRNNPAAEFQKMTKFQVTNLNENTKDY